MPEPTPPTNCQRPAPGSPRPKVLPLVPDLSRPPGRRRPLPDAAAVRPLPVPDSAPPYDDESQPTAPRLAELATAPPAGRPGAPQSRPPQPRPPDRSPAADGRGWPGQFAQVLAETLAGSRPHRQIVPWTNEQARKRISRLGPMLAAGDRPVVRRVVASSPAADVVEMTVVVRFGPRVRALAVRLERDGPRSATPGRHARQARWLCTAIEAA